MPNNQRQRLNNAVRHVTNQLTAAAVLFEAASDVETCPHARAMARAAALELRRLSRIVAGDIGEEQTEIEAEPLEVPGTVPTEAPAAPEKVPA